MALRIDSSLTARSLLKPIHRLWELSAERIRSIERTWRPRDGTPVFTVNGRYTSRGWTEWTQGFQYGSAILQFDATDEREFLEIGRRGTVERMAAHVSHTGVHDHGFNNVSTYGNLLRLLLEGRIPDEPGFRHFLELALKISGAVQASRWTRLADGTGFIHSFNGPHSLFVDTIRSLRILQIAHELGHVLMAEQDERISLRERAVQHALNTARYNVYYGEGRDAYDVRGRTAHEAIFNTASGVFRCPNSQQGFSPFSTWTRGLAWAILGFAEQLEFHLGLEGARARPNRARTPARSLKRILSRAGTGAPAPDELDSPVPWLARAAEATAEFYLENCCADGIPMWDTGAPNLHRLGDYLSRPSDPFNPWEPVDSSAAAIAAQGMIRLGNALLPSDPARGNRYRLAGFTIARTLFSEPYLSTHPRHQGLILHSIYHRPNGWDSVSRGQRVPNGESSMWGDYHARELALLIQREANRLPPPAFCPPAMRRTN